MREDEIGDSEPERINLLQERERESESVKSTWLFTGTVQQQQALESRKQQEQLFLNRVYFNDTAVCKTIQLPTRVAFLELYYYC